MTADPYVCNGAIRVDIAKSDFSSAVDNTDLTDRELGADLDRLGRQDKSDEVAPCRWGS